MNDEAIKEIRELKDLITGAFCKRLLTINEACNYLGIGSTEAYAQLRSHVRTIKHGKKILIPKEELDALIERAKRTGTLVGPPPL
jgi:excisionase family DNA binding protein